MSDVLTIGDIRRAAEALRAANGPPHEDGCYHAYVTFDTAQEARIWATEPRLTYRQRDLAWSLLRHERWRYSIGRRPDSPSANEILRRAVSV